MQQDWDPEIERQREAVRQAARDARAIRDEARRLKEEHLRATEREMERYLQRRRRIRILMAAAAASMSGFIGAIVSVYQLDKLPGVFGVGFARQIPLAVALLIVVVASFGILLYLRPEDRQSSKNEVLRQAEAYVDFRLSGLGKERQGSSHADAAAQQAAVELLRERLQQGAADELLAKLHAEAIVAARHDAAERVFRLIRDRMVAEIVDLAKRGSVNLVLGMLTTLVGICVLWWSVYTSPSGDSWIQIIGHFAPRSSLALLIEVFAYFFLRLYRQSLSEIKYFQGELTNVESRWLAALLAADAENGEAMAEVIRSFHSTERNFVLKRGQTTVDIERERIATLADARLAREALAWKKATLGRGKARADEGALGGVDAVERNHS